MQDTSTWTSRHGVGLFSLTLSAPERRLTPQPQPQRDNLSRSATHTYYAGGAVAHHNEARPPGETDKTNALPGCGLQAPRSQLAVGSVQHRATRPALRPDCVSHSCRTDSVLLRGAGPSRSARERPRTQGGSCPRRPVGPFPTAGRAVAGGPRGGYPRGAPPKRPAASHARRRPRLHDGPAITTELEQATGRGIRHCEQSTRCCQPARPCEMPRAHPRWRNDAHHGSQPRNQKNE